MLRAATLSALESVPLGLQVRLAWPLLSDPVRAVRIEAARLLAAVPAGELDGDKRALMNTAIDEHVNSQLAMAERPEAQANLGNLYAVRGEVDKAIAAYQEAMSLEPRFVPAYINLADAYRLRGDEVAAEQILRQGLAAYGDSGDLHHALGLSLIRRERLAEALFELQQAARQNPENTRFVYVYGLALNTTGKTREALMVLQGAHNVHPNDTDILSALVAFHRDAENSAQATDCAQKLEALAP